MRAMKPMRAATSVLIAYAMICAVVPVAWLAGFRSLTLFAVVPLSVLAVGLLCLAALGSARAKRAIADVPPWFGPEMTP